LNALLRPAPAALLNTSAYPGDDDTAAEVLALVQGAFASGNYASVKVLLAARTQTIYPLT